MTKKKDPSRRNILVGGAAAGALVTLGVPKLGEARAKDQVPRRKFGKTGETIPILLMGGSMKFDPVFDHKLAECLKYGVNYLDAAYVYAGGTTEPAMGSFVKKTGSRKKVWITSKSDLHSPDGFEKRLGESLQRLQTNYVDLYYMHGIDDASVLNKKMLRMAEKLKKQGKTRFFGFSCHDGNVAELMNKAAKLGGIDSIMFRYNFRQYGNKELNKAIDACAKAGIGLIAMKTQGSAASFKDKWAPFQKTGKWNKHQAVLKAVWEDKRITAAVSHMDSFKKLRENIAAALNRSKLTSLERQELERYAASTRSLACDGCDHICGAAVEAPVRIGATMRYLMYHDVYGEPATAQELYRALPAEARQVSGVDFSGANRACPNGIDVTWHMRRANEVLS